MRRYTAKLLSLALAILVSASLVMPANADPRRGYLLAQAPKAAAQKQQLTAREAAAQAQSQYGGKVLKVSRAGQNFKVRLLQDSGRVITVTIRG
jgi:hypothetical protein